jgi:hypothetical protein
MLLAANLTMSVDARGRGRGFPGRGFAGNHCGYRNHYDNYGRWGRNRFDGVGAWGGWGRPNNRWIRTGWGGWAAPYYGGPGYGYDRNAQSVDEEGTVYPSTNYNVGSIDLGAYAGHSASETVSAEIKSKPAIEPVRMKPVSTKSVYKLGPDTDVLDNGSIAVRLNDKTFLLVHSEQTLVVDQKTGVPSMALYTDPLLLWNLSHEIKRQSLGLKASVMSKQSALTASTDGAASVAGQDIGAGTGSAPPPATGASKAAQEIENMEWTLEQLDRAQTKLGKVPDQPPNQAALPAPDMVELFASVWLLKDGSLISFKQPDGTLVYMNNKGTFCDRGKTARSVAYPDTFELAVYGFLKTLINEYKPSISKLNEDKEDTEWALSKLAEVSDPEVDQLESQRRLAEAVSRSERRLSVINSQIRIMPDELDAAKRALAMLDKT